jgi:release factor glutamine methyltransferase
MYGQLSNFAKNNTMQPTIQYIRKELKSIYPEREIESLIRLIFHHLKKYSLTDLALNRHESLSPDEVSAIRDITVKLKAGEPVQYVLGYTDFAGMHLKVNPSVLIPRPETEELTNWISQSGYETGEALDIGTGSGCIAMAIKRNIPGINVSGCDISPEALETARQNAENAKLNIRFFIADILRWKEVRWPSKYDLIVSNPPYVTESEKQYMHPNVLDFEPGQALFVPDSRPLVYYEAIVQFSREMLNPGGDLYFEINERFGAQMAELLEDHGFEKIEIKRDIHGRERMIRGKKPNK